MMTRPPRAQAAQLFDMAVLTDDSRAGTELIAECASNPVVLEWSRQAALGALRTGRGGAHGIRRTAELVAEFEVLHRQRQARHIADHRLQFAGLRALLRNLRDATAAERPYVVTERLCLDLGFRKSVYSPATPQGWSPTTIAIHPDLGDPFMPLCRAIASLSLPAGSAPREEEAMRTGRPVAVDPIDVYRNTYRPLVELSKPRGYLAVPVVAAGRVVALLHADQHEVDLEESDMIRLRAAASVCALTEERNTLRASISTKNRTMLDELTALRAALDQLEQTELTLTEALTSPTRSHTVDATFVRTSCKSLTSREHEVFELLAQGISSNEIAAKLYISDGTVKSHIQRIYRKLHISTRAEAAAVFRNLHRQVPGSHTTGDRR